MAHNDNRPGDATAPRVKVILPNWTEKQTKMDSFLETCERLLEGAQAPNSTWVAHVLPKLPEKARAIFNRMPKDKANQYEDLKKELLDQYTVSPLVYRKNFFTWEKRDAHTFSEYMENLQDQLDLWIRGSVGEDTPDWPDLLLRYRLDQALPEEVQVLLLGQGPRTARECATYADDHVTNQRVVQKSAPKKDRNSSRPETARPPAASTNSGNQPSKTERPPGRNNRSTLFCNYCKKTNHTEQRCFFNPESSSYRGNQTPAPAEPKSEAAGFVSGPPLDQKNSHIHPYFKPYIGNAWIAGDQEAATYLRDTGATLSFLRRGAIPSNCPIKDAKETVTVTGIHQHQGTYPLCKVPIDCDRFQGTLTVAVTEKPPLPGIDLLLGNDLEHHSAPLEVSGAVVTRSKKKTTELRDPEDQALPDLFRENGETNSAEENHLPANDVGPDGAEASTNPTTEEPAPDPFAFATDSETLLTAQMEDPTLTPLWALTRQHDQGYQVHPQKGILMYQGPEALESEEPQIVVPKGARRKLLEWSHDHPSAGHLGNKKMLPRLKKYFTWPGIRKDVMDYCRGCGPCQRIGKGVRPQTAPLKSLPVIGRPFSLISADFVGPLPITAHGNRYLLTVMDHATKYLEAIPLPVANAEHAKRAFIEVFSRHGLPSQLLTDRDTTFTSQGFQLFLEETQIEHLLTSSYRPESNATIERAHGTIKQMVKACLEEASQQEWDSLLPWILFAYRSAVHSSTGYSPFMLMYGREPTDLMGLVYSTWLDATLEDTNVPAMDYVRHLRDLLDRIQAEANAHELHAKEISANSYNRRHKAKPLRYRQGDLVLIQLPQRGKPLAGEWQGPYPILEVKGDQTYLISTPDKRTKKRQLHANALRRWTDQPHGPFTCAAAVIGTPETTLGDIMDAPPEPTDLENRMDPGNFGFQDCIPDGSLPDLQHLEPTQQAAALQLCQQYSHLFNGPIGRLKGLQHDVDVGDHAPITQHYYRTSPQKLQIIRQEVDAMLEMGVVRPSHSEWSSPLILVKKPQGKWRPCIDYRRVNEISKGETFPLPRLDDLVDQVGNARFITTVDLSKGYWQVELTDRARQISAFSTPFGHYEFNTMPFGMRMAPMTFQRAMNELLSGLSHFAVAYLDDISIRSDTWEEHLMHVQIVFDRLTEAGLTLNAKKCTIGGAKVSYLGHEVGCGTIAPIHAKTKAIAQLPPPKTKTEVRSFLGSVGFYRKFIPYYSDVAAPLTDLLKGGRRGDITPKWTPECQRAYEQLRDALVGQPILKAPDFDQEFAIYTDASEVGIAAVLTQVQEDQPRPVAYYSRKLLPREKHYSTIEKELLAIMAALDTFHVYVGFGPVTIHSDHRPLVWLRRCTTANQRVLRWALSLSEYDLKVVHIKGPDNYLADMLSRQF